MNEQTVLCSAAHSSTAHAPPLRCCAAALHVRAVVGHAESGTQRDREPLGRRVVGLGQHLHHDQDDDEGVHGVVQPGRHDTVQRGRHDQVAVQREEAPEHGRDGLQRARRGVPL